MLVVASDAEVRRALSRELQALGYAVSGVSTWDNALKGFPNSKFAAVVFEYEHSDPESGGGSRFEPMQQLAELRRSRPDLAAIALVVSPWRSGKRIRVPGVHVVSSSAPHEVAGAIVAALAERTRLRANRRELNRLYKRARAGGVRADAAWDDLCRWVSAEVRRQPRDALFGADPDFRDAAIDDALTKLWLEPARYDPQKGGLVALVKKMARDGAIDLVRQRSNQRAHAPNGHRTHWVRAA